MGGNWWERRTWRRPVTCTAELRRSRWRCSKASAVFVAFAFANMLVRVAKLTSFVSSFASLTKSWNSSSSISNASVEGGKRGGGDK